MQINILSLFDGMSCCQIALNKAGIKYDKYFASEIDKHAIKVTQANYPDTIQIGSAVEVPGSDLPEIFLLAGGSPCQSFSFAGKRKGMTTKCEQEILSLEQYLQMKSDGFEFEGQSYLFWEFVRLLHEVKPKYFLLENVMMEEKWERIITRTLGVHPIMINAALVSAQSRKRLWWTNIGLVQSGMFGDMACGIKQPKDRGILLRDILEKDVDEKYYLSEKMQNYLVKRESVFAPSNIRDNDGKASTITVGDEGKAGSDMNLIKDFTGLDLDAKSRTIRSGGKSSTDDKHNWDLICVASRGRNPENPTSRESGQNTEQQLEPRLDGKTNTLTSMQKDNLVMQLNTSKESNGQQPYQQNRVYDSNGISPSLDTRSDQKNVLVYPCDYRKDEGIRIRENGKSGTLAARARNDESCGQLSIINSRIRRLTPTECERLQTVPDSYTAHVSDSQRYKMLGNGWCCDVPAHIFTYLTPSSPPESTS